METEKTDLAWMQSWVKANFDKEVSISTVSRWLGRLELSIQLTSSWPMGKNITFEDYATEYWAFLVGLPETSFFKYTEDRTFCVDFVTLPFGAPEDHWSQGRKTAKIVAAGAASVHKFVPRVCGSKWTAPGPHHVHA